MPAVPNDQPTAARRKADRDPWQTLQCEDGYAIVVPDDWTDALGALINLLADNYGGEWSRDNPVLSEALKDARIEVWHSFTKRDIVNEGVDWEPHDGTFYGSVGSGAKHITALWYWGSLWDLGERAEAVEPLAVEP